MKPSDSAHRMHDLIKKAIQDHIITDAEYNDIMKIADEDGHIDMQERALLIELQEMIKDKTVKRVRE